MLQLSPALVLANLSEPKHRGRRWCRHPRTSGWAAVRSVVPMSVRHQRPVFDTEPPGELDGRGRHRTVLCMSDEPAEGTARPESGLTDDDFSPIWADDDRPRIPRVAGEREALVAYLEYYRATVEMKCRGLTPEQARTRSMPPSSLSIHGVVRHLAGVERWWFQQNFERRDVPFLFFTEDDPGLDFDPPLDADFSADLGTWRAECVVSREIVAAHDLDDIARPLDWYEDVDLRWLVLRMISEYAQHCGHVDLLREGIDGRTGA